MLTARTLAAVPIFACLALAQPAALQPAASQDFRPPSLPLAVGNPYFSVWSRSDRLTDDWPRHWTGAVQGMSGLARIDGKAFRWCGPFPQGVPAMASKGTTFSATATTFAFEAGGVRLEATWTSPTLATDPDLASRTVTLVSVAASSLDGSPHDVRVYLDVTGEWCTHESSQQVSWSRARAGDLTLLRMGTTTQAACARAGDHTRIDWGYVTLAAGPGAATSMAGHDTSRAAFAGQGTLPESDDLRMPRSADDDWPVLAASTAATTDGATKAEFLLAYDDGYCVEYFGRKLRPYWARGGMTFGDMVRDTWARRGEIRRASAEFDRALHERLAQRMPPQFARVCELAYRQVMGAHCIATDFDGTMLMFSKENTSNGCIATVDVLFPASPFLLAMNPDLLEASLRPLYAYAASPRWKFDFAPHDLGTYPKANGQVYGGGERTDENQMPVEECGNMLILTGALAKAKPGWQPPQAWVGVMDKWAEYLVKNGLDPANQLCTDDFAGHLARNANLAVKACVGVAAYGQMLRSTDFQADADMRLNAAAEMAAEWQKLADAGDHTVLVYAKPETWSLKYNMFWDRYLGTGLFDAKTRAREVAWYLTKIDPFGVPMDSRQRYTKPEWMVWSACLASNRADFDRLVLPIVEMAGKTPDRVPLTDWYMTTDAKTRGMYARSVVGGLYAPLLVDVNSDK